MRCLLYRTACRNPLQVIMGNLQFLKEQLFGASRGGNPDASALMEDINAISSGAQDMKQVVDNISDWVKVSVGKLELQPQPTSLSALLSGVVCQCCSSLLDEFLSAVHPFKFFAHVYRLFCRRPSSAP